MFSDNNQLIQNKNYLLIFPLLFILLFSKAISSQEVKLFKSFGVDSPMSYKFVRTIAQDHNGFMWFGSSEGLHRYDGYQLISYHHDSTKKRSLSSDVTSRILIDKQQRLWIATHGGGLNLYQETSQNFYHFTTKTQAAALTNDTVNALMEDSEGYLWVGTDHGLNIITPKNDTWSVKHILQSLGDPNSLSHNTINSIIQVQDSIWVGTGGGGISVFDLKGNFVKQIKLGAIDSSLYLNKFIFTLLYDEKDTVWIGTVDKGLIKYSIRNETFIHFEFEEHNNASIISNTIEDIYQDSENNIWIATDKGALIYNKSDNNFWRFNHSANNPYSLSNDFVLTFFQDSNNIMWVGTFTGVNRWDPNMTTFGQYSSRTQKSMLNNNITSFAQLNDNEMIFSSYSGGLYTYEVKTKKIKRIDLNGYFSELRIMSLFVDGNTLWIGTRSSGLFEIDLTTKVIKKYSHEDNNPHSISANSITDIIKDRQGNLWISTFHQGMNRLNRDKSFTRFIFQETLNNNGPSSNHILHLLEDDNGYIWLATYGGGFNRFNPQDNSFKYFRHDENDVGSISSDLSWVMLLDRERNLWVGTQAAGLNLLTKAEMENETYSFVHIDSKDGMKSRTVYGIEQDIDGFLWLSSNKGISRYSPVQNSFKHFDLSHGLIDLEYNHGAIFSDNQNSIFFGAGKGITHLSPKMIQSEQSAPLVRLTNVFKLNEPMSFIQPITELSLLSFEHSDQLISFEYVGLNYANPNSTDYKYRLLGFDQQWIDAGKLRRATYTNLPEGNYVLQIIAGNNDDVWSKPYQLNIVMRPAPWRTWWAYMAYVIIIALSFLSYSRLLNKKLVEEQKQKEDLKCQVQEKTQEYLAKNEELELANNKLELAATVDKLTGVKSRRYLDIYIDQASQLMNQIHQNLLPVQRNILPRLYILMVQINDIEQTSNSQLINLTDLLLYSRNNDDLVIRWSENTFAIIGYEKENNVAELSVRLSERLSSVFKENSQVSIAYSFYPFNREQPVDLSWDQVSVIVEKAILLIRKEENHNWIGLYEPKEQPFDYIDIMQINNLNELQQKIVIKHD